MKKFLLGLGLSVLISLPVLAALKVGEKAPDFSARASLAGKEFNFSLEKALKKGPVVVYFFPSAYTKGCDLEAHTFCAGERQIRCRRRHHHWRIGRQPCAARSVLGGPGVLRRKVSGSVRCRSNRSPRPTI